MDTSKKFLLQEKDIPTAWYNVMADMKNKPRPMLNPANKQPMKAEDLYPLFNKACSDQEFNTTDQWIEIPEEVREMYKIWRPTPLVRARGLEKLLDTPAHIYFKNESVSPVGSHKLNSAIAQAYYCKQEGVTNITTETGAGQWGAALSLAAKHFGLALAVYMVKVSYHQKPYRRSIMQTYGAEVIASPSMSTRAGKDIITNNPNYQGSLGTAISEAVELARTTPNCKYVLGSVLNHVGLHQTVIGLEAEKQMEMAGEYPDVVIGCFGGGSNFSGISFPFMRHNLSGERTAPLPPHPAPIISVFFKQKTAYQISVCVTGVQTCALPISAPTWSRWSGRPAASTPAAMTHAAGGHRFCATAMAPTPAKRPTTSVPTATSAPLPATSPRLKARH